MHTWQEEAGRVCSRGDEGGDGMGETGREVGREQESEEAGEQRQQGKVEDGSGLVECGPVNLIHRRRDNMAGEEKEAVGRAQMGGERTDSVERQNVFKTKDQMQFSINSAFAAKVHLTLPPSTRQRFGPNDRTLSSMLGKA